MTYLPQSILYFISKTYSFAVKKSNRHKTLDGDSRKDIKNIMHKLILLYFTLFVKGI